MGAKLDKSRQSNDAGPFRRLVIFAPNSETMLQVNHIRQHTELVKERLAVKHFSEPSLVDEVLAKDDERKRDRKSVV